MYLCGVGVRVDPAEEIRCLRPTAAQGHADAQFAVGEVFERCACVRHTLGSFSILVGKSDVDASEAMLLFRLAAK